MVQQVRAYGQVLQFPDDMSDDDMAKAIQNNEHVLNPNFKAPEGLSGIAKNVVSGTKQTGRMVGAGFDTIRNELAGVEDYAKASDIARQQETPIEQRKLLGELSSIDRDQGALGQIGDTLSAAGRNPMGTAQMITEQLPNTAVSLGGGYAGFKTGAAAGALFGPVGATIGGTLGFLGGMFLGNVLLETGGKAIEKASDEDGYTPEDRDNALREGAVKGAVITGVDAATLKLGSMVTNRLGAAATNAGAKAEAKVLIEAGVDMSSTSAINAALKSSPELLKSAKVAGEKAAIQALSKSKKVGIIGTGLVLETAGEGIGEYAGEMAATGKGDVVDATIEALSSATQSIAETAYNFNKLKAGNDLSADGMRKVADSVNEMTLKDGINNISKSQSVDEAIQAAVETVSTKPVTANDVLKTVDPTLLDVERLTGLKPSEVINDLNIQGEQDVQSETSQKAKQKAGQKPVLLGNDTEIVLPDGQSIPAKWAVVDADQVSASIKEGINQPRDRTRAASDIQIQGIANNPDYRRLSDSVLMDTGSPTLSYDGLIVGGNGRFEGISRAHETGSSGKYRESLLNDALSKGIDVSLIQGIKNPVLVRQITQPFDTRKLAVASNSGTNMQYSGLELAKIDAGRMFGIEDLDIADNGDIAMTGANFQRIKQSLADYNQSEIAAIVDKNGALSQDGVKRIRNAILAKAYGNSETLGRMVESTDNDMRNVLGALTRTSGAVARVRSEIKSGAIPEELDITDNLLNAVETLAQIRSKGQPLDHYLSQENMFGDNIDSDSKEILQYLHDNIRSQKKMAEFINNVYGQIGSIDQSTEDIFGDNVVPTKKEVIDNAKPTEQDEQQGIFSQQKPGGTNEQESKTEADNSASGKEKARLNIRSNAYPVHAGEPIYAFTNTEKLKLHKDYIKAKSGDIEAAIRLVKDLVPQSNIDEANNRFGSDVVYVPVILKESSGTNRIPHALAALYSSSTGSGLYVDVHEKNKAFHTGMNMMERLISRAEFTGNVDPNLKYVLVDDVTTSGATLADFASYIQNNGGEVLGSVLLTNAMRTGSMFPLPKTINRLEANHENTITELFGIAPQSLTKEESQYLLGFRTSDELRNRAITARDTRSQRIAAKSIQKSEDNQVSLKPSRSPEERIKDRERAKQLERKLREQGFNFTVTAKDVRDFTSGDRGKENEADAAEKIAKIFGRRIVWIEARGDHAINGVVIQSIKDTIFIDVNTYKAAHAVMGHELSHHLEHDKPEVYKELTRSLMTVIRDHPGYAKKYGIEGARQSDITKEIVGDIMGDNFTKPEFWSRVAEANPSVFKNIADTIISWLRRLIINAKARSLGSEQWVTDAQKAQDIVAKAVAQYTSQSNTPASGKAKFHSAFHGSPHDYDKFDSSKIGTGEGAQAYGHGLYFAESKDVAEYYKKVLTDGKMAINGIPFEPKNHTITEMVANHKGSDDSLISRLETYIKWNSSNPYAMTEDAQIVIDALKDGTLTKKVGGKLYQVELAPKQDEYLLWDRPLSEQSDKVIASLENKFSLPSFDKDFGTAGEFYRSRARKFDSQEKASSELYSLGIRGIKYIDGSSRHKKYVVILSTKKGEFSRGEFDNKSQAEEYANDKREEGFTAEVKFNEDANFNYVIFDENDVTITAKFSKKATDDQNKQTFAQKVAAYQVLDAKFDDDNFIKNLDIDSWEALHNSLQAIRDDIANALENNIIDAIDANGKRLLSRNSTDSGNDWRITSFDADGDPLGHSEYRNAKRAVDDLFVSGINQNWKALSKDDPDAVKFSRASQGSLFGNNDNLASQEEVLKANSARPGDLFSSSNTGGVQQNTAISDDMFANTGSVEEEPFTESSVADPEESPAQLELSPEKPSGKIEDFGEKIGGARKDMERSLNREYTDDDIATQPLSKIWPKDDYLNIENPFLSAFYYSAREQIPTKPKLSYRIKSWVQKVKMFRGLAKLAVSGSLNEDKIIEFSKKFPGLENFFARAQVLSRVPNRQDWSRVESVAIYPDAGKYDSNGIFINNPMAQIKIDGRTTVVNVTDVDRVAESVNDLLQKEKPNDDKKMQFELRGRTGSYFINKKGDREYRKLKTFTDLKEASQYLKNNYDDLVAAWELVKESDNVKKTDVRGEENRPRTGQDWRQGKDVTPDQFQSAFGFRGVEFGNWVSQGKDNRERQGMLNQAYDALMDLSNIVGVPPKALSLNGSLGLGFGSRGKGAALAHFEPGALVINLTKTKGAGNLAHEWFHAMDNYFQRQRGELKPVREDMFITYRPEQMMMHKKSGSLMTQYQIEKRRLSNPTAGYFSPENWVKDPNHPMGVRPEVEAKFSDLVKTLDESPMKKRAEVIDKGKEDGYWSRIIERAARSFENYVIAKMMKKGYNNDYLANVTNAEDFARDKERYPYLLESEVAPVEEAFDNLFAEIKTKETDNGIAMFSRASIPETINIKGVERPTTNSDGNPIHSTEAGIRAFYEWFGESKLVDEQGRPKVYNHSTKEEFNKFKKVYGGIYLTTGESTADEIFNRYGEGFTHEVYIKSENPFSAVWKKMSEDDKKILKNIMNDLFDENDIAELRELDSSNSGRESDTDHFEVFTDGEFYLTLGRDNQDAVLNQLEELGYDSVEFPDSLAWGESNVSTVIFDPLKIKSVDNNGQFSSDNDDIRFSFAGKKSETAEGVSPERTNSLDIPRESRFRKFQRKYQDSFNRFTVVKEWLVDKGINLSQQADVYAAEERYHAKIANQVEDFREQIRNPLIEKIAKAGFTMDDIADYLEAQHAPEANAAIRKLRDDPEATAYGIADDEAREYLSKAPGELGKLANELRSITEQTKKLRLDGGLLNKDITDAWEATYKHYIPVKGSEQGNSGTGKGMSVKVKNKRRLGHGRRDEAVIENILQDHERAIMEVEKNRVGKHVVMMAAEIGIPELMTIGQPVKRQMLRNTTAYEVQVKGRTKAVFDTKEGANLFRQSLPLTDKKIALSDVVINPTADQRVVMSASPMLADNEINVYIDGHAIRVQINDELMARAYKKLGIEGYGEIVSAGRMLNSYLSKVYTGYNPEFIMTNMVRDFTTGVINLTGEQGLRMAAKAISNYPKSFATLLRYAATNGKQSTDWIDAYRRNGGNTGAAYLSDMERLGNEVASEYAAYQGVIANLKQGDMANAARAAGRKAYNATLKWIYNLNQAGENAMRLSAFKAMIDSGMTVNDAAKAAKNITVNFNRKGELGVEANAAYLFFNASVQGTAATLHALVKGKNKYQAWALASGLTTLGYLAAASLGGGSEDDYDKIDDYTKERNALIKSGDGYLKLPIPYGYGFFWNVGRSMADAQRKDELHTMPWHIAASAIEELTPFGSIVVGSDGEFKSDQVLGGALPTVAQIPYQISNNKQLFSGGELMPDSPFDQSQPDREKMWRGTKGTMYDQVAGWLAVAGMDVSPETLKFMTRTATGGAGALVDSSVSAVMLKTEGAELDTEEMPFIRKAYKEISIKDTRSAFYKAREEAKLAAEEFNRARRKNDLVAMQTVINDKKEMLALDAYADKLSEVIRYARDQQDAVRLNKDIPIAEKRLRLKELEVSESKFYDKYLDVFNINKIEMRKRVNQ